MAWDYLFGTEAALAYMTRGRSLAKPLAQVSKKFASLGGVNKAANTQRQFFQGLKTKSAKNVVRGYIQYSAENINSAVSLRSGLLKGKAFFFMERESTKPSKY